MAENMKLEDFSPHLNSNFLVKREPEGAVELQLIDAKDVGSTPRQEQFSIVFRGPHNPRLEQAIYSFEHQEMGAFDLFIVPFKQSQEETYYEAIFNRPL